MAPGDVPGAADGAGAPKGQAAGAPRAGAGAAKPGGSAGGAAEPAGGGTGAVDYDAMYTAAFESNMRVRHWVGEIYALHGMPQDPHLLDAPRRTALGVPALAPLRLTLAARYLVLELWNFQTIFGFYTRIKKGLDVKNASVFSVIVKEKEVSSHIKDMRDNMAHPSVTFNDFVKKINSVGLAPIVRYARAVLMFEDAIYRTVPHERHKIGNMKSDPVPLALRKLPTGDDARALEEKYAGLDLEQWAKSHGGECAKMGDLQMALLMLYVAFRDAAERTEDKTLDSYIELTTQVYNAKYMILDICNFIAVFKKAGLDRLASPGFLAREETYTRLRHDYATHTKISKIRGMEALLAGHPDLLGNMLTDIVEINALMTRMHEWMPDRQIEKIAPMDEGKIAEIDRKMRDVRQESQRLAGRDYTDPDEEGKRRAAREGAKRNLGLR